MTAMVKHGLDDMPWVNVDELLDKRVVHGERMSVTQYRFAAGGRFPNHVHPQEQITYCLSGSIEFRSPEGHITLEPNQLVVIPPGVEHEAEAGPSGAVVLSSVSPSRRDVDGGGIELREAP